MSGNKVERVQPLKWTELGEKIYNWATDPKSLPAMNLKGEVDDVEAFREEMKDLVHIPPHIQKIIFVRPEEYEEGKYEYYIRLPLKDLVELSIENAKKVDDALENQNPNGIDTTYQLPDYYEGFLNTNPDDRKHKDMLFNRIADYTFAHCK